ncbi:DUF2689 domain-containing protein [Salmonella enterica subsp. enterica serovar Dessau]|uniref:DUF2689 domain-containing protein n=2 Tax=Salmonella enterica TaxID=28901 RepID=A0A8E5MY53_SALET|nr:DUF2689 domain-containing protein [Salmonella enterica subsp. enterica serovar Dessau]
MIKMNIRNVISVPDEPVQDDFVKSVISNCTTKIIPAVWARQEQRQLLRGDDLQVARCRGEGASREEPGLRRDRHAVDRQERPR